MHLLLCFFLLSFSTTAVAFAFDDRMCSSSSSTTTVFLLLYLNYTPCASSSSALASPVVTETTSTRECVKLSVNMKPLGCSFLLRLLLKQLMLIMVGWLVGSDMERKQNLLRYAVSMCSFFTLIPNRPWMVCVCVLSAVGATAVQQEKEANCVIGCAY